MAPVDFKKATPTHAVGHPMIADLDGDGSGDLVLHVHVDDWHIKDPSREPGIYWFSGSEMAPKRIYRGLITGDRFDTGDINRDGFLDIISGRYTEDKKIEEICWYENPGPEGLKAAVIWKEHIIGIHDDHIKDILTADLNNDGLLDIVSRGHGRSFVFVQRAEDWIMRRLDHPRREGLALGDLDLDGDQDILMNGFWFETPENIVSGEFIRHTIDPLWFEQKSGSWQDNASSVAIGDLNGDGLPDVVIGHSEKEGFPIAWYSVDSLAEVKTGPWIAHQIVDQFDWCETLDLGDVDNDGDLDVLAAKFERHSPKGTAFSNEPPYPVALYLNDGRGENWTKMEIANHGIYAGKFGDLEGDGDLDIVGPDSYFRGPIHVWLNQLADKKQALDQWHYIEADDSRGRFSDHGEPSFLRYFGLDARDMDRDGDLDIVSGRYIYRNPGGSMEGKWVRAELNPPSDGIVAMDVDGDVYADVIGMSLPDLYWYEATSDTLAEWTARKIGTLPPTDHTNSQGFLAGQVIPGGVEEVVMATREGTFYFMVPENGAEGLWEKVHITRNTSDEGIHLADMDGDGWLDLVGAKLTEHVGWWRNPGVRGGDWEEHIVAVELPHDIDRVRGCDMNGDGLLDIVATEERWPGKEADANLYWFERPVIDDGGLWIKHLIYTGYSMNNLDVADLDRDGDMDIITSEHKGSVLNMLLFENNGKGVFTKQILDQGKESHLGTLLFDLDQDGDLDITSIGWDQWQFLHVWRNDAIANDVD